MPFKDCNCCSRSFTREAFLGLPLASNGREFGAGLRFRICLCGSTITVPLDAGTPCCIECREVIDEPVPASLPGTSAPRFLCGDCGASAGASAGERQLVHRGVTFHRYGSVWACVEGPAMRYEAQR